MCFDSLCVPMNPIPEDEGRPLLIPDARAFIAKVELAFDLPDGILRAKVVRPVRKYGELSLSEIRSAIIVYLFRAKRGSKATLAESLNLTWPSVLHGLNKGMARLGVEDREFMVYYEVITKIK